MEKGNQDKGKFHADDASYELSSRSTSSQSTTPPVALSPSHQDNNLNQQSSLGFLFSSFSAYLGRVASPNPFSTYLGRVPSPNSLSAYLGRVASPSPFSAYLGRAESPNPFPAYFGRVASQFKKRTIDIEEGFSNRDKGKSRAEPPVPASPQQDTSSLPRRDKGKSRATDSSVSQTISSSDTPYETSLVIRSTSSPPVTPGQPIASSSSRRLEDIPSQNTSPSVTPGQPIASTSSRRLEDIPSQNAQPPVEAFSNYESQLLNTIGIPLTIRITRWRVINTYFLLVAGTAKSISAYKNALAPANSLDLVIGIVWALISYWFSIFEAENPNIIPWLFKPVQLDTRKTIAPIVIPCSAFLFCSLYLQFMLAVSYLTKRFDERFQLKFFSFIIVTMIVVMIIVLSIGVLLPVGFKFLRSVYAKLELHAKLWSIIKPIFHSDDWELTGQKEVPFFFYGCFPVTMLPICLIFIEPLLFLPPLPSLEDPSAQVRASVAASLAVFPMYLVWGFGRMGIRLARWLYNKSKAQIKDILSSVSAYSMPMSNQTQRGGRVL